MNNKVNNNTWFGHLYMAVLCGEDRMIGVGVVDSAMVRLVHCVCVVDTLPPCQANSLPKHQLATPYPLAITTGLATVQCVFTYMSKELSECKYKTVSRSVGSVGTPMLTDVVNGCQLCAKSGNMWPTGGGGGILCHMVAFRVGQCPLLTHIHFHNNISVSTSWTRQGNNIKHHTRPTAQCQHRASVVMST